MWAALGQDTYCMSARPEEEAWDVLRSVRHIKEAAKGGGWQALVTASLDEYRYMYMCDVYVCARRKTHYNRI